MVIPAFFGLRGVGRVGLRRLRRPRDSGRLCESISASCAFVAVVAGASFLLGARSSSCCWLYVLLRPSEFSLCAQMSFHANDFSRVTGLQLPNNKDFLQQQPHFSHLIFRSCPALYIAVADSAAPRHLSLSGRVGWIRAGGLSLLLLSSPSNVTVSRPQFWFRKALYVSASPWRAPPVKAHSDVMCVSV